MASEGHPVMEARAYVLSCPAREGLRRTTIANLEATDWLSAPEIIIDQTSFVREQERQEHTALRLLETAIADGPSLILFLEDDLNFNRHLRHNLECWYPLRQMREHDHFFASLYNPNVRALTRSPRYSLFVADPNAVYGSQAFLLSVPTGRYIVEHWGEVVGGQDIKMSRLAARVCPIYYHAPSLVQHIGVQSTWGGRFHAARDFSADWRSA